MDECLYAQWGKKKHLQQNILFRENTFRHCLFDILSQPVPNRLHSIRAQSSLQAAHAGLMTSKPQWACREGRGITQIQHARHTSSQLSHPFSQMWTPPSYPSFSLFLSAPFYMQREERGEKKRERKWKWNLFMEHQIDSMRTIMIFWIKVNLILLFQRIEGTFISQTLTAKPWILSVTLRGRRKNTTYVKKESKWIRTHKFDFTGHQAACSL